MSVEQVKVAVERQDGGLSIMSIVIEDGHGIKNEITTELIQGEISRSVQNAIEWFVLSDNEIPQSRIYRNSWENNNGVIVHNMIKARDIHRERMRFARIEKMEALDVAYMMADESGDNQMKRDIADQKNALREVTDIPEIEEADTIEELMSVWPDILK